MTNLERGPSSDGESAICATSLNNSSSTLVERLKRAADRAGSEWFYRDLVLQAATIISELEAERERLHSELDTANNNHRSMACQLAETGERALAAESALYLEKNKSDNLQQNYEEVSSRHPSFNDAIEAAAKVAENFFHNSIGQQSFGPSMQDGIAAAVRSLKLPDYRGGEAG